MSKQSSPLRSPLKRARGLGSAHSGVHHFWVLRISSLAIIPLSIWFLVMLITVLIGADRAGVANWMASPLNALLLAALIVSMFLHARLGIQEIILDYVPHEGKKIAAFLLNNVLIYGFGAASLLAILHLHLFGITR